MGEPLTIWWVRHGPTHAKTMIGWTDLPADLSDAPVLARLRAYLPDVPVVSSDLLRARQTAEAIAGDRPRLSALPELREIHFGAWEHRSFEEIESEAPDHIFRFWDQPGEISPPGGESWNALADRVNRGVAQLHGLGEVIAVAHFGAILTQVQRAQGVSAKQVMGQYINNLSVTRLSFDGQRWSAHPINHRP
ncbi:MULTISPECIES: histidine phosphatase family protein [unclassified Meridianimarinicoccus]|uniref:histidine phosphatase family protein n=1 Tax=unclassified Meridianimarinicoccus TaxID=2923344 RepID=UPI00186700C6|nr:histidine phosphatase family protein [Fluviibacterium sp. MJW13]